MLVCPSVQTATSRYLSLSRAFVSFGRASFAPSPFSARASAIRSRTCGRQRLAFLAVSATGGARKPNPSEGAEAAPPQTTDLLSVSTVEPRKRRKRYHWSRIQPLSHRWFLIKGIKALVCPFAVLRSRFGLRYSRVRGRRQSKFLASSSTGGARNFYPKGGINAPPETVWFLISTASPTGSRAVFQFPSDARPPEVLRTS